MLRMEPAQRKVAHHEVQPRDAAPAPTAVKLTLLVQAPNGLEVLRDLRAGEAPDEVFGVAVARAADDDVRGELGPVLEHDAVLGEVRDLGVVLDLDLAVDDELAAPDVCVRVSRNELVRRVFVGQWI